MSNEALGMVETKGLIGAIEATDATTRATNMAPIGYERIDSGLITAIVRGDVGTMRASVDAGTAIAANVGQVVSQYAVPRPYTDVGKILPKSL